MARESPAATCRTAVLLQLSTAEVAMQHEAAGDHAKLRRSTARMAQRLTGLNTAMYYSVSAAITMPQSL